MRSHSHRCKELSAVVVKVRENFSEFIWGESFPVFTCYMPMAHSLLNPSTCTVLKHFFHSSQTSPVAEMHIVQLGITLFIARVFGWKPALTENPAEGKRNKNISEF